MLDIAVIGAGPAGLSAGINAKVRNKNVEIFGNNPKNTWLYKAENLNNHLGFENVTGKSMLKDFISHVESMNIKINYGRVIQILNMGEHFVINFDNNIIEARAIILCTGIEKKSGIKNESDFVGKGLSYCATCDGMLYKGKNVVLYGETEEGEEEANFLSEICNSVTYIYNYEEVKNLNDNIKTLKGKPSSVIGDEFAKGIVFEEEELLFDGLFFIRENTPTDSLIHGLEKDKSIIITNKLMETNISGVFASGDCTGWPYQVSKAVGEGLVAAQQAVKYLDNKDK